MLMFIDRMALCGLLMANGSKLNCTSGVGNVAPYLSLFNCLEIIDQVNNPAGYFNISQLYQQARQLPYVMTDLLKRNDIMMLYSVVLPERSVLDVTFLYDDDTIPTTSISPIPIRRPEGS